ncbi:hypothetical protein GV829_07330 [Sphingomonas lacunae]|uniref:Uncharacterized protein n=1 Tax=Sphingomonas lacunae TaxID=2698828 RepID=A0A6M4AT61_9SPHN|nr:hypothetical protein [Sphingomonas lacunae]QJQ32287.1 hypothetical protein GV829_07330 [Sphingomonas lacunae]
MTHSDEKRLEKLQGLLARLRRGENVQNRQLQTWLGEQGFKVFEDTWSNVVELRNTLTSKPGELIEYEMLLKKAIMLYNRGEAASLKGQASARRFHAKAQAAFEKALLRLEEMMGQDPSLQMWLDRHCDFTAQGTLSLDPIGMPRVITSRSPDNQSSVGSKLRSKRDCKIAAVEAEIERIRNPREESDDELIAQKLQRLRQMAGKR